MNIIGIDIGTTSVSVVLTDARSGEILKSITKNSESFIETENTFEKIQSVEKIEKIVFESLEEVLSEGDIGAIGVTGQMHGIVYLDINGAACSPLYTWQDSRAALACGDKSYSELIKEKTGCNAPAGYGFATHYYNLQNSLVPENAVSLSTVHDYFVMRLCGNKKPLMHISDAASLGLFDAENCCFDKFAAKALGIPEDFLPEVTDKTVTAGYYKEIPVSVAIGDNQASFLGSVKDTDKTVLINIGTGSQISLKGENGTPFPSGEVRPLAENNSILVGSALCGGRAYAVLEGFFKKAFAEFCGECGSAYEFMNRLAEQYADKTEPLYVNTEFSGTRTDPDKKGSITGITTDNFTPQHLICGFLKGVVTELYEMYGEIAPHIKTKPTVLVGSGNGLRKSRVMQKYASDIFGLPLLIPAHTEEAAFGACIFALAASGISPSLADAQKIIKYR